MNITFDCGAVRNWRVRKERYTISPQATCCSGCGEKSLPARKICLACSSQAQAIDNEIKLLHAIFEPFGPKLNYEFSLLGLLERNRSENEPQQPHKTNGRHTTPLSDLIIEAHFLPILQTDISEVVIYSST